MWNDNRSFSELDQRNIQLQIQLERANRHIQYLEEKILSLELDLEKANANK